MTRRPYQSLLKVYAGHPSPECDFLDPVRPCCKERAAPYFGRKREKEA